MSFAAAADGPAAWDAAAALGGAACDAAGAGEPPPEQPTTSRPTTTTEVTRDDAECIGHPPPRPATRGPHVLDVPLGAGPPHPSPIGGPHNPPTPRSRAAARLASPPRVCMGRTHGARIWPRW